MPLLPARDDLSRQVELEVRSTEAGQDHGCERYRIKRAERTGDCERPPASRRAPFLSWTRTGTWSSSGAQGGGPLSRKTGRHQRARGAGRPPARRRSNLRSPSGLGAAATRQPAGSSPFEQPPQTRRAWDRSRSWRAAGAPGICLLRKLNRGSRADCGRLIFGRCLHSASCCSCHASSSEKSGWLMSAMIAGSHISLSPSSLLSLSAFAPKASAYSTGSS